MSVKEKKHGRELAVREYPMRTNDRYKHANARITKANFTVLTGDKDNEEKSISGRLSGGMAELNNNAVQSTNKHRSYHFCMSSGLSAARCSGFYQRWHE